MPTNPSNCRRIVPALTNGSVLHAGTFDLASKAKLLTANLPHNPLISPLRFTVPRQLPRLSLAAPLAPVSISSVCDRPRHLLMPPWLLGQPPSCSARLSPLHSPLPRADYLNLPPHRLRMFRSTRTPWSAPTTAPLRSSNSLMHSGPLHRVEQPPRLPLL